MEIEEKGHAALRLKARPMAKPSWNRRLLLREWSELSEAQRHFLQGEARLARAGKTPEHLYRYFSNAEVSAFVLAVRRQVANRLTNRHVLLAAYLRAAAADGAWQPQHQTMADLFERIDLDLRRMTT